MVGVAFEVHDTYVNKQELLKDKSNKKIILKNKFHNIEPSFADLMMYSYCYIGLLTGKESLQLIFFFYDIIIKYEIYFSMR